MKSLVLWKLYLFIQLGNGVFSVSERVSLSLMEGDSLTLDTNVKSMQEKTKWHSNDIRIAEIHGDLSFICTDVQCNEGTERFRDRLKLDNQTGSLTITNIINTDTGEYTLEIINSGEIIEQIFSVSVHNVSAAERNEVKEGDSVTLNPGVSNNPNDVVKWYYNDTLIAEITGNQSQICTDDQCKERFRDRLKLDNQTGSLTITHTTNTHSGLYHLEIFSNRFRIGKRLPALTVIAVPGSGLSPGVIAGIVVGVAAVLLVAAAVIYYYRHRQKRKNQTGSKTPNNGQPNDGENNPFIYLPDKSSVTALNGMAPNGNVNVTASET